MRRAILFAVMLGLSLPLWAQEIPLTSDSYGHFEPQWSPDGNWVAYYRWDATGNWQIYKVPSAGGAETPLTSDSYTHNNPQWSPDGNWIVYYKNDATGNWQIYKVPSAGGVETPLTSDNYGHDRPQWSPDGNWVVYYKNDATGYNQIYKVSSGTGIEEEKIGNNQAGTISVFPNPTFGDVTIHLYSSMGRKIEVDVYDESGRFVTKIYNGYVEKDSKRFNTDLPAGIYFIRLKDGNSTQVKKFIIVR